MKITYLDHSSFLIETEQQLLLLDYGAVPQRPAHGALRQGVFDLDQYLQDQQTAKRSLIGYASHRHADHFDAGLAKTFLQHDIPFILSDEQQFKLSSYMKDKNFHRLLPHTVSIVENIKIANTGSTDQGGSILFEPIGSDFSIYYGADLAVWDDFPEFYRGFDTEYNWLKQQKILFKPTKIVFLPSGTSDGYQEEPLLNGAKRMIDMLQPEMIIPMHGYGYPDYYRNFSQVMQQKMENGSLEIATFKEYTKQDRHWQNRKIVIYPEKPGDQINIS